MSAIYRVSFFKQVLESFIPETGSATHLYKFFKGIHRVNQNWHYSLGGVMEVQKVLLLTILVAFFGYIFVSAAFVTL